MCPFELVAPATPEEALVALRTGPPGATAVIAGGTDLLLDVENGRSDPKRVVSLRRLPWRTLAWADGALTIGSTLPLRVLEDDPEVPRRLPGLAEAVRAVGSVALRHRATMGGNLGRSAPASDLLPVLLALDAEVELFGPDGVRTLPVDRFVRASRATALGRHELIRAVRIPEARPSAYRWQRVRPANDISQVAVAAAWSPPGRRWAIAVGGVPPRPVRIPEAEAALGAGVPTETELAEASDRLVSALPIATDQRASEEYRRHLAGTLLERAVRAARPPAGSAR